jgi:hypothetical protein
MIIAYHGTDRARADSILLKGFRPYTYFAAHLEDALAFGGPFVFEVWFRRAPAIANHSVWQFKVARTIPPRQIRSLTRYSTQHIHGADLAKIFSGYRKEKANLRLIDGARQ